MDEEQSEKEVTCWGCNGKGHGLRDCDTVTDEAERARVVELKRAGYAKSKNKGKPSQYAEPLSISAVGKNPALFKVKLNEVEVEASDRSIISRRWLDEFQLKGGNQLVVTPLNPIDISLADS